MASLDYVLEGYWVDGYAVSYQGAIVLVGTTFQ